MKEASALNKNLEEDIILAKMTEQALKRYDKLGFKTTSASDFLKILEKC